MARLRIDTLDISCQQMVDACVTLLFNAFAKPERYSFKRLSEELQTDPAPFYRQFFIAMDDGEIIGVGGVKAADWASNTHLLYLSAVTPMRRRQGIGRALIEARINWVEESFKSGRILVSSGKDKRYRDLGFIRVPKSGIDGRHLLIKRF